MNRTINLQKIHHLLIINWIYIIEKKENVGPKKYLL